MVTCKPCKGTVGLSGKTLFFLTALCRGDAVLADLIRMVAATLEREQLATEH